MAFLLLSCGTAGTAPSASRSASLGGSLPSASPTPSTFPLISPSPTPRRSPAPTATPAVSPSPGGPAWTALRWSDPVVPFPDEPPAQAGGPHTSIRINDLTEWDGGYVGVGTIDRDGACAEAGFFRSSDALHWTLVDRAPSGDDHTPAMCPRFVARVGDGLLAIGQARIWQSEDGRSWSALDPTSLRSPWGTSGADELLAVAALPSGVVVIGQPINTFESIIAFSRDGRGWTPIDLPAGGTAIAWDVTATRDRFVIVGRDGQPDTADVNVRPGVGTPAAWVSTDGRSWTETVVSSPAVRGAALARVLAAASGPVAIGNDRAVAHYEEIGSIGVWTSADGRSWATAGTLERLVPRAAMLASDGSSLVALRNGTTVWISTDGRDWNRPAVTGTLEVPAILLGPLGLQPAAPRSEFDTRMWVVERGLIVSSTAESPGGFAVIQMQLGTATRR